VNERLEEPKIEETLEPAVEALATEEAEPEQAPAPKASAPSWQRLAYTIEFLIAIVATFELWSQVGGQGHLEMLPWYSKLVLVLGLDWCCVRFTAGMVEEQHAWNPRSARWLMGMIVIAAVMGGITFYYHLHEVPDDTDTDDTTASSAGTPYSSRPLLCMGVFSKAASPLSRTSEKARG